MSESEKAQALEDAQHAAVMRVLKSHFGHSAVEADMEDAAWSVLAHLDEFLADDPSAFPKLKANVDSFADRMARQSIEALDDTWRAKQ